MTFNSIRSLPSNTTTTNAIAKPAAPVATPATPAAAADPMADIRAELARLKAENEALKASKSGPARGAHLSFKVSEKGCLSVYGNGRFPTTLYKSQWLRLVEAVKDGSLEKALQHPGLKEPEVKG
jgi:hypothetical protein